MVFGGGGLFASLVRHVLENDGGRRVVAYSADSRFITARTFEGLPLVPFEELEAGHPPSDCELLICIGWRDMNGVRKARFDEARRRGYRMATYVSTRATVWPDLEIPENCIIHEGAIVQSHARIGENVIIRSGANIGHHSEVGSHAFVSSGVTTGGAVVVGERAFLGVGAVLRDHIRIAERCLVGAGAVVVKDTSQDGVYVGSPARATGRSALDVTAA